MKDDWLEYVPPTVFHSRNEVYEWLAQQVDSEMGIKKEQIVQALLEREETGDIQIDEGVLLPHIENQLVKATKVIILPLEQRIANWNPAIQQVELILAVFLAPQEKIETKRQIANFIIGVAACTVGIAHTYIAQEKLENAAKKAGHEIHVETQGTIGIENELTPAQIKEADLVILAVDVKISGRERFEGKRIIQVPTEIAIKSPNKLIEKAMEVVKQ